MQKPMWFSMGLMSGVIAVLLTVVVMQGREPVAYAQAGGLSGGGDLMMRSGGSTTNINDIIWVLHKKKVPRKPGADPNDMIPNKIDHVILASYQLMRQGRSLRLVAVRDISWDLDIPDWGGESPSVRDIVGELKKASKPPRRR